MTLFSSDTLFGRVLASERTLTPGKRQSARTDFSITGLKHSPHFTHLTFDPEVC